MLRLKSASRLLGGAATLLLAANLSALRADDEFQLPISTATGAPISANASAGDVPPAPAAVPAPSANRWARRNQQLREAAGLGTPVPQPAAFPQQPMELKPTLAQTAGSYMQAPPAPAPAYVAQAPKLPFSGKFTPGTAKQGAIPELGNLPEAEQVKTPSQLPKVTQIMPFLDYEPDPKVAAEDPCQNLCPRPDGAPCKTTGGPGPECPKEIQLSSGPFEPRVFPASTYTWQASNIFYQPLYFEDPDLERYGHAWPFFVQPVVSSLRFTVQAIGLPYQMTIDPYCCRVYPLGYYRPGECAPKLFYQIPWNTEAAAVEAGTIAGVYFLFPHSAWVTNGGVASP
ncbi:MAG TPA: hypothetical protein VEI07_13815 [Planctomycetaceae bacterium]|nr:hypothetical protein [Planctomycetaceae bacterium]